MKIAGNQIRPGNILRHKDSLWRVVKAQAVQPGKSGAYAQVELRNLLNGSKLNERFRASESVERVQLQQRPHTFLFREGSRLVFMDVESYEQIEVDEELVGEAAVFLSEGLEVELEYHEETPINVRLPAQIEAKVVETEPAMKGRAVTSSYKPAILDNGVRVMVPEFIASGERIVVDIQEVSYVRRA